MFPQTDHLEFAVYFMCSCKIICLHANVDLLDVDGEPTESNVNMTFYDTKTGKIKYNFNHTMKYKGIPDTLSLDPSIDYKIQVHTLPEVIKEDIQIVAGQHNHIPIETPQGTIEVKVTEGKVRALKFIVREEEECAVINVQSFKDKVKYLVGTYDVEILTLPRIKRLIDVEQSENSIIRIPAPGLITFKNPGVGFGSIYTCLLYTSPSPRDGLLSRMPSSA